MTNLVSPFALNFPYEQKTKLARATETSHSPGRKTSIWTAPQIDFDWLIFPQSWLANKSFGSLWVALGHYGSLWVIMADYGSLGVIPRIRITEKITIWKYILKDIRMKSIKQYELKFRETFESSVSVAFWTIWYRLWIEVEIAIICIRLHPNSNISWLNI